MAKKSYSKWEPGRYADTLAAASKLENPRDVLVACSDYEKLLAAFVGQHLTFDGRFLDWMQDCRDGKKVLIVGRELRQVASVLVHWCDSQSMNAGAEQLLRHADTFEDLGIEVFEQPIPMTEVYGMKKLLSSTTMNIALDEAAMGIPYLIELIRREAVEGVAIKINKVGGIWYARQMCDLARNAGFKIIGSGLMDAPIGFQASVQLFSAYGIDFPADLNGPQHMTAPISTKNENPNIAGTFC